MPCRRAAIALLFVAGCAQQSGSAPQSASDGDASLLDGMIALTPVDHWDLFEDDTFANASILASSRDAVLTVSCVLEDRSVTVFMDPKAKLTGSEDARTVTARFDGLAPQALTGLSGPDLYLIRDVDPGFDGLIEQFRTHRDVEFAVSDSGKEIMRHQFALNGAPESIDKIYAACGKTRR